MSKYLLLLISILVNVAIVLSLPSTIFAVDTCIVNVTDKDTGQPIQGVSVKVFNGKITVPDLIFEGNTDVAGNYSFLTNGFGMGSLATNKLIFNKGGYKETIKAWSDSNQFSCPPPINQTIISNSVPITQVYICTTNNQCATIINATSVPAGTISYNDQGTCQANCTIPGSKWSVRGTPPSQDCIPDVNGSYNSQIECERANNIGIGTVPTAYDYIPTSKQCSPNLNSSCLPNPTNGICLSLADCEKYKISKASTSTSVLPPGGAGALCYLNNGEPAVNPEYVKNHPENIGILTAIGCVPTEPTQFILAVSKLATGVGGGIALLLMITGAFKMITSAGNPDHVKEGSEQITSAIIGLLFIIFAVLLLKVIGVDILDLPGFEPSP